MNTTETATRQQLTAALSYWSNCRGKGTAGQRAMVEREIAVLEGRLAALTSNEQLLAAVTAEDNAYRARHAGRFDAAAGFDSLSVALRAGQLTPKQLHSDSKRCRVFGARATDL